MNGMHRSTRADGDGYDGGGGNSSSSNEARSGSGSNDNAATRDSSASESGPAEPPTLVQQKWSELWDTKGDRLVAAPAPSTTFPLTCVEYSCVE